MFNVIIDTREKKPWTFDSCASITGIINHKLKTGDYAIQGLENVLCIERKKSVSEIATNITTSRFEKELMRMSDFEYKFLILEFDYYHIDIYPEGSDIPKHKWKMVKTRGPYMMRRLSEIAVKYNIHVIACSNASYANHIAIILMKRVWETKQTKR